jgi:predicted CopG family antitoxin
MATKTLTITEDAYNLLVADKLNGESFSKEIQRVLGGKKKRKLSDFFGILSDDKGQMQKDLKRIRKMNLELLNERLKMYESP